MKCLAFQVARGDGRRCRITAYPLLSFLNESLKQKPGWKAVKARVAIAHILEGRCINKVFISTWRKERGNIHVVQNEKLVLISHDRIGPAFCQLRDTVDTLREDGVEFHHSGGEEEFKLEAAPEGSRFRIETVSMETDIKE
jgi:hypothetical protein